MLFSGSCSRGANSPLCSDCGLLPGFALAPGSALEAHLQVAVSSSTPSPRVQVVDKLCRVVGLPTAGLQGLPSLSPGFCVNFSEWGCCLKLPAHMPLSPTPDWQKLEISNSHGRQAF